MIVSACQGCDSVPGTGRCSTCHGTAHVSGGDGYYRDGQAGGDWCPKCWDEDRQRSTGNCTVCKGTGQAPF